jgi:hypothetical protein
VAAQKTGEESPEAVDAGSSLEKIYERKEDPVATQMAGKVPPAATDAGASHMESWG